MKPAALLARRPAIAPARRPAIVPAIAALLLALFAAHDSRADAVDGPPSSCPPGARGESSHNGPWCQPTTCKADTDCGKSTSSWSKNVCHEQPLCVETRSEGSRSGWSFGTPITREIAHGVCDSSGACPSPASCQTAKRCIEVKTILPTGKCAVSTPGAPSGEDATALGLLLIAAMAVFRRRR
jgi:MYXO-CTERM domain-containing protein